MRVEQWLSRALVLTVLGLGGCPAVLDDNFTSVPGDSGAGSAGRGATAGSDGGAPDTGGVPQGGGTAGNKANAGSSTGGIDVGGAAGGLGGEGGAHGSDICPDCSAEECCDGVCVDLAFDPKNCRACGTGCPGTTCDNSSCTNSCAFGFIDCNHNVVDGCEANAAVDPKNCGNCGIACGFQLVCEGGNCRCPQGTADCDGKPENGCEADTSSDPTKCGGCGTPCGAGQRCTKGVCGCDVGSADCNLQPDDGCEASLTGDHSCGSCALDCGVHGKCVTPGTCGCMPGYLDCDAGVPGCETPITDPNHCGNCATVCSVATPACDGTACSAGCGALTRCGSSCVDTQVDLQNCGGCGKPVGLNQTCVQGKPVCVAGYGNCDANPNDCEVVTDTDTAHCGDCATACKAGALCTAGSCACAPNTPNDCGSSCQQCCNDGQCSDGNSCTTDTCSNGVCGASVECSGGPSLCCAGTGCFQCCGDADCGPGKVCSAHQCVNLTCAPPQIVCNNECVNPTNDANNCSSCDAQCGLGRTCALSACTPKWVKTAAPLAGFVAREQPAYTAAGSKVFIWGGLDANGKYLADGALYDPDTDTWTAVSATGAPAARALATAVWTGSVVVVWGGGNNNSDLTSGSRYDLTTNSWQAISAAGAPTGKRGAYAFWTGSRVLVWGGTDRNGNATSAGGLYDPVNDKWTSIATNLALAPRVDALVGWTGSLMPLYGGNVGGQPGNKTFSYNPASNVWNNNLSDGPAARWGAFGTWDGTYLTAWSGGSPLKADGKIYEPVGDKWTTMATVGQPASRWAPNRETGWSVQLKSGITLMVGGMAANSTFYTNGGIYNSTTNSWSAVSAWPSGASHLGGVGVWTGTEFVVWGGHTGTNATLTAAGERYRP